MASIRFAEPEEEEKPKQKLEKSSSSSSSSSSDKKSDDRAAHRRVFTKSSQQFASIKIDVKEAKNLKGKKSGAHFVKLYVGGGDSFLTKNKKGLNPVWNETFESAVDRDEFLNIKIWDEKKLADYEDSSPKPVGKVKINIKDLIRDNFEPIDKWYKLKGTEGELHLGISLSPIALVPGQIHTKTFSYPTWQFDKYGINNVEGDLQSLSVGITTITRYAIRWMRSQRASLNDGTFLKFNLIDFAACYHNRALQLVVSYFWEQTSVAPPPIDDKAVHDDDDLEEESSPAVEAGSSSDDHLFERPKVLQVKCFVKETMMPKKRLHHYKPMSGESYSKEFNYILEGTNAVLVEAQKWINEHRGEFREVFKVQPVTTDISHHVIVWYYK